jgi:uncharacterized peroxidase-related enzyme
MAFIRGVAASEAMPEVRAMYARQQSAWGFIPNYAKVFSLRPEVLARWGQLQAEIRRPMDNRRFELVTFAAALELRSSACALAHGSKLMDFFEEDEVLALAENGSVAALTDAERAMIAFSRKVARDASKVTAGDVDALRKYGLSDAEIFDVAATAAGRAFFTKLLDGLGVEPDAAFLDMDPELRKSLTVGRPIDFREPEVMPVD